MAAIVEFPPVATPAAPLGRPSLHSTPRPSVLRLATLVVLCGLVALSAVLVLAGSAGGSTGASAVEPSGEYVEVGPGDTMLSILLEHRPSADPSEIREAVADMAALNGGTPSVELGQVVALPAPR
ncbi:MAG: hypothetical protein ACK5O2_12090 [Microthrixaceae bacterium]